MKRFVLLISVLMALILFLGQANALTITAGQTAAYATGPFPNSTSNSVILEYINDNLALPIDLLEDEVLFKGEEEGGINVESGSYAISYNTNINFAGDNASGGTISYVGLPAPSINVDDTFLFVKDGNHAPIWYLYDLGGLGWDGTEILELEGFWYDLANDANLPGAISHVSIYGNSAPVPEPATMMLFGIGLLGLAGVSRRKK